MNSWGPPEYVHYSPDLKNRLIKDAKPNQEVDFVCYNREFVVISRKLFKK